MIKTIYGKLDGTQITEHPSNSVITAFPYRPIREEANGKTGFFNLKYAENLDSWIIYSFFEVSIEELSELLSTNSSEQ
jgi:hypothetical protein